mmetsp:Transcript_70770/g.166051  ORF Transcript_70770/g.166051 Transcript_70770/m.166051 type:complete len:223 (+) Transcript_70770:28-696(+)
MCQSALRGILRFLGVCDDEAPEIYRARYARFPASQTVPSLLRQVVASAGAELDPKQVYVRASRKFPLHFLHSTLRNGGLSPATYYFEVDGEAVKRVFVHWSLDQTLEGPGGHCHGGCLAALMDDAFGAFTNTYLRSRGRSGRAVTAFLHVDYKAPTPLPSEMVCVVTLDQFQGRKIFLKGHAVTRKAPLQHACEATALFVELKEKLEETSVEKVDGAGAHNA